MKREYGKLLSQHTSLKIGGPAFCWLEPETRDEVLEAVSEAGSYSKVLALIGKGTNILAQDKGFEGIFMKLGRGFDYITREDQGIVRVGGAAALSRLVKESAEWGLSGCEFLSGIPGSFGGAAFMNAGARGAENKGKMREIKDLITDLEVLDLNNRKIKTIPRDDIPFKYRSSGLEGKCVLGGTLRLDVEDKESIRRNIEACLRIRRWIEDLRFPSAGSIFKNPDDNTLAGRLIEDCGLKGRRIGGAEISMRHGNFIVNRGGATSRDVLDLIELARKGVRERFGIELELELKVI